MMDLNAYCGIRLGANDKLPITKPKIQISPHIQVSDHFRMDINQWLYDTFGESPYILYLGETDFSPEMYMMHPVVLDTLKSALGKLKLSDLS